MGRTIVTLFPRENPDVKLCFIFSSLRLSGGVKCAVEIANRLVKRGYEVSFVIPGRSKDPEIGQAIHPQIRMIESGIQLKTPATVFSNIAQSLAMARVVPRCDVLFSTHTPTTAVTWIAAKLAGRGKPIWYGQDYIEMFLGRPVETWLMRNALRWHLGGLVVSQAVREELAGYVPDRPVLVVSNGISGVEELQPLSESEWLASRTSTRRILYLGDARPRKGWNDFWAAAELVHRRIPDLQIQIVSKDAVTLPTEIPHALFYRSPQRDLADLYANCDVFVSASWWEGFGLPGLEAMACGAPLVTTDSRGVREYADPGVNCLMVEPRQPAQMAEAIGKLLEDRQLALRLRAAGIATASRFRWDDVTDRFEEGFKKLCRI